MHLIQILIPVFDNEGHRFHRDKFERERERLTERFGGLTAFVQSPALGLWKDAQRGATARDEMILIEVMVEAVDRAWWSAYRRELEDIFRQEEIVVRAIACDRI
ncbi:MAG TPA: hypothetical protein VJ576_08785 [Rhodocyclaceae bacterium]|nr:hypothetical protein [Rhodocyclaceae bacterium]